MLPEHTRSGEPHHALNLFAPIPLIAMYRAFCAGWLIGTEPAAFQPQADVTHQPLTLLTQKVAVSPTTIDVDHSGNCFPLARQSAVRELNRGQWSDGWGHCVHLSISCRGFCASPCSDEN